MLDLRHGRVSRSLRERNWAPRSEKLQHLFTIWYSRGEKNNQERGIVKMSLEMMKRENWCFVVKVGEEKKR